MSTDYVPLVTGIIDDYGSYQGMVWNRIGTRPSTGWRDRLDFTDDSTPLISGTSSPGTTVYVFDNFNLAGAVVVKDDWTWSLQVLSPQSSGFHEYSASLVPDQQYFGNQYSTFLNRVLTPVITGIYETTSSTTPPTMVENGGTTSGTHLTVKGTSEPYSNIDIYDNGLYIGSTTNKDNYPSWDWELQLPSSSTSNSSTHSFSAIARTADNFLSGDPGTPTEFNYNIGIGVAAPKPDLLAPVITSVVDDAGVNQGAVADGGQTNDIRPTLHGTSEPGTVVTISDNGHAIGTATTGADWQWSFTPSTDLAAGASTLSVSAARADGTGSVAAWYTHGLDVTPSLDAVLATAGLSAAPAAAAPVPTVQAAYVSEAATAAVLPQHDLAY